MILDASFKVFRRSYNDIETCKKFDLKRLNYAAFDRDWETAKADANTKISENLK